MRFVLPLLGFLLLVLLLVDVFLTIFHAAGRGGPINRRQNRLLWGAFRWAGMRRNGASRSTLMAFAGPTLVATTLLVWLTWLVLGFFLIYLPFIDAFLYSPGFMRTRWMEALYFSVYTAATLGLGDVVADAGWLRLVGAAQAMCGFVLFSLSITYLLSVYGELIAQRATASRIAGYFDEGEEALADRVERVGAEAFARWADEVTMALLTYVQSQFQYPVINYFHAVDRSRALPVQLRTLVSFDRVVQAAATPAIQRLGGHPSYLALGRAVDSFVTESARRFVPRGYRLEPGAGAGAADQATVEHELRRLNAYMGYLSAADRGPNG
jgi:hypothetical protein